MSARPGRMVTAASVVKLVLVSVKVPTPAVPTTTCPMSSTGGIARRAGSGGKARTGMRSAAPRSALISSASATPLPSPAPGGVVNVTVASTSMPGATGASCPSRTAQHADAGGTMRMRRLRDAMFWIATDAV